MYSIRRLGASRGKTRTRASSDTVVEIYKEGASDMISYCDDGDRGHQTMGILLKI